MITGERSELEIFEMCMQKYQLITLKMLFSKIYFENSKGGGGGPDPFPPQDPRPLYYIYYVTNYSY